MKPNFNFEFIMNLIAERQHPVVNLPLQPSPDLYITKLMKLLTEL